MKYILQPIRFVKIFLMVFLMFLLYHTIVWTFFSSKIFGLKNGEYVGDLGRTSYQLKSLYLRKLKYTLPKTHLGSKEWKDQKIDILTIGDSFSNADTGGKNPYYQDYLASYYKKNILNLKRDNIKTKPFTFILSLYNNKILEKIHPQAIIIESVERFVYDRYTKDFDFNYISDINITDIAEAKKEKNSYIPKLLLINTANYRLPYYTLLYEFKFNANKSIPRLNLSKNVFSNNGYENKLLITREDIQGIHNDKNAVLKINKNLNKLARKLKKLNIKLFFMVAPDRYDVFSKYIVNSPYPKNKFFDMIRPLKKEYYFVDTKQILQEAIDNGEQDIYYPDDTHWSYKASEIITKDKIFYDNLR